MPVFYGSIRATSHQHVGGLESGRLGTPEQSCDRQHVVLGVAVQCIRKLSCFVVVDSGHAVSISAGEVGSLRVELHAENFRFAITNSHFVSNLSHATRLGDSLGSCRNVRVCCCIPNSF